MSNALITALYFLISLFPLVLVHELGHFLLAKLNGVRVDEFGIGFPPRLVRLARIGETDYTLNWLPLGGFVRMPGMDDPDVQDGFLSVSALARTAVLLAGPFANFAFAAVVLAGLAGLQGQPNPVRLDDAVRVTQLANDDSPAARAGMMAGDIVVAIDGQPIGQLSAPAADQGGTPTGMQALIDATQAAGRAEAALELTLLRGFGEPRLVVAPDGGSPIEEVDLGGFTAYVALGSDGSPVQQDMAGMDGERAESPTLLPGDTVMAPAAGAGVPPEAWSSDGRVDGGQELVVLRPDPEGNFGSPTVETLSIRPEGEQIGILIGAISVRTKMGPLRALAYGAENTVVLTGAIIGGLWSIVSGAADAELAGPVGIARMGRQAGEAGSTALLSFMVMLSINLGIFNLLPIPGLDGGRLLFIGVEALRGRRLEPRREELVHIIGIVLVLGLVLWITVTEVFGATPAMAP